MFRYTREHWLQSTLTLQCITAHHGQWYQSDVAHLPKQRNTGCNCLPQLAAKHLEWVLSHMEEQYQKDDFVFSPQKAPRSSVPIKTPRLTLIRNMKPPAVTVWSACQAETWATGALLCVGVGWSNQKKDNNLLYAPVQKREHFKRSWRTREMELRGIQISDKQRYKTRGEANSGGALRVFKKFYPVLSKTSLSHCSVMVWFSSDSLLWMTNSRLQAKKTCPAGEKITVAPWLHIIWMNCFAAFRSKLQFYRVNSD